MQLSTRSAQFLVAIDSCEILSHNFLVHMDFNHRDVQSLQSRGLASTSFAGVTLTAEGQALVADAQVLAAEAVSEVE